MVKGNGHEVEPNVVAQRTHTVPCADSAMPGVRCSAAEVSLDTLHGANLRSALLRDNFGSSGSLGKVSKPKLEPGNRCTQ